jgi:hypothetical protein
MANSCLAVLNNVSDKCLVGIDVRDALSNADHQLQHHLQNRDQICYLARTNLTLFKKVVEVLGCDLASSSQKPKPKISFPGVRPSCFEVCGISLINLELKFQGIQNLSLDLIVDVYNLWRGGSFNHNILNYVDKYEISFP